MRAQGDKGTRAQQDGQTGGDMWIHDTAQLRFARIYILCATFHWPRCTILTSKSDSGINAETVDMGPSQPRTILTWNGYHTHLEHSIKADPGEEFKNLTSIIEYFNISLPAPLTRQDLPQQADPNAFARQQQVIETLKQHMSQRQREQEEARKVQINQQIHREEESVALRARLEASRHRNAMTAISNIGGGGIYYRY